jgi:hypothetical protein
MQGSRVPFTFISLCPPLQRFPLNSFIPHGAPRLLYRSTARQPCGHGAGAVELRDSCKKMSVTCTTHREDSARAVPGSRSSLLAPEVSYCCPYVLEEEDDVVKRNSK